MKRMHTHWQLWATLVSVVFVSAANAQPALTVNIDPADGGYVGRFPSAADFIEGEVTVTATPAPGYEFVGWQGDLEGTSSSLTFDLTEDTELTAVFQEITHEEGVALYQLSAFVDPSGAGTIVRDPALFDYEDGTEVTLTAYADEGYVFTGWTGDVPEGADATASTLVVTMSSDLDVQATFAAALTVQDGEQTTSTDSACGAMGMVSFAAMLGMMLTLKLGRSR
jgi:uncharacterized repeat protein (TIGR02543 family)